MTTDREGRTFAEDRQAKPDETGAGERGRLPAGGGAGAVLVGGESGDLRRREAEPDVTWGRGEGRPPAGGGAERDRGAGERGRPPVGGGTGRATGRGSGDVRRWESVPT